MNPLPRLALPVAADEGMWTYFNLPTKQLKEKYGFEATQQWLDHLRMASVRFNDGGSGSFISPSLVITNHHVASGQLQKVGDALSATNKLLALGERQRIIDFFVKYPNVFFELTAS